MRSVVATVAALLVAAGTARADFEFMDGYVQERPDGSLVLKTVSPVYGQVVPLVFARADVEEEAESLVGRPARALVLTLTNGSALVLGINPVVKRR